MQYSSSFTLPYLNSNTILFIFMEKLMTIWKKLWNSIWFHLWLHLLRKNKCPNDDLLLVCLWWLLPMTPSYWLSSLLILVQQIFNLSFDIYDYTQQWNYSPNMPTPTGDCIWSLSHYLRWLPPMTTSGETLSHLDSSVICAKLQVFE